MPGHFLARSRPSWLPWPFRGGSRFLLVTPVVLGVVPSGLVTFVLLGFGDARWEDALGERDVMLDG